MSDNFPLMLFAAGFGTRMGVLTRSTPKPLLEVGGKTLLSRAEGLARAAGVDPIVSNTHYLADQLTPVLQASGILESHEPDEILDTGGGLKAALPLLGNDVVATMNPDVVFSEPNPLETCLDYGLPDAADALLLVVPSERAAARKGPGDFSLDGDGRLTRNGEYVYTGVQLIRSEVVAAFPDRIFSLNAVWDIAQQAGRLFGVEYPGQWCDVGYPEAIPIAEAMLRDGHDE